MNILTQLENASYQVKTNIPLLILTLYTCPLSIIIPFLTRFGGWSYPCSLGWRQSSRICYEGLNYKFSLKLCILVESFQVLQCFFLYFTVSWSHLPGSSRCWRRYSLHRGPCEEGVKRKSVKGFQVRKCSCYLVLNRLSGKVD